MKKKKTLLQQFTGFHAYPRWYRQEMEEKWWETVGKWWRWFWAALLHFRK